MTLSDKVAYRQVIGDIMHSPILLFEHPDLNPSDFDLKVARVCFVLIQKLYQAGAATITPVEIDQEVSKYPNSYQIYIQDGGLDFLKVSYEFAEPSNFEVYYQRVKKTALLRELQKKHYDISNFYVDERQITDPLKEIEIQERFDKASIDEILNQVEANFNDIRKTFVIGRGEHDPADGIDELIASLQVMPDIGIQLEGDLFSSVCRGARQGCFYLKSASSSAGKTRTAIFDACHFAYPIHWSEEQRTFVRRVNATTGEFLTPNKVLFIVTEMDKEELQTIILAYLSGVNETHILTGQYEFGELTRVQAAASIMKAYSGYFLIEEIPEPDLTNVAAVIKKYATVDNVKYVMFDYIHTTANMVSQFARNNLREDVILMMLANQLKQLAKDYNLFISSATQVNASGMLDDLTNFKNETSIRGAKAIADKADIGYVMSKIDDRAQKSVLPQLRTAIASNKISISAFPTHVFDIYKVRRGRYKNVRVQSAIDLGTGRRRDLFLTTADNQLIPYQNFSLFITEKQAPIEGWEKNGILSVQSAG